MLMTESKLRKIISEEVSRKKYKKILEQATPPGGSSPFPLKSGSEGKEVQRLQLELGVAVDGKFGPETEAALEKETGSASIEEAEYRELLGLSAEGPAAAGPPQLGNISGAEVAMLNAALAQADDPGIPEQYKKSDSQDLRDFWPAWAQFLILAYEPKTINPETQSKWEGVLDPRVIYAQWDDVAAEQLGYSPDDLGAIQFIQAKGLPKKGSKMAEIMGIGAIEAYEATLDGVKKALAEIGPKVNAMQSQITFPVSMGKLAAAADIFAKVVAADNENLGNSKMFAAIYAIQNTSWKEGLSDLAAGAALGGAGVAFKAAKTIKIAMGIGAGAAATGNLMGRSITSMLRDGFDKEAAILGAALNGDIEMAEDISRINFMANQTGNQISDGLAAIVKKIVQDDKYTKAQALMDLKKLPGGVVSIKEGSILNSLIDNIIYEVTMGVPEEEQAPFGSEPFVPGEEEEEDAEAAEGDTGEEVVAATGKGRGRGRAEAAVDSSDADLAAARGAPGTYSRQKGRTQRTQARQGGRTERAYQRQASRGERRDQRGERQSARGERRSDRRADRRAARAERRG